jgi:hypothetical protein
LLSLSIHLYLFHQGKKTKTNSFLLPSITFLIKRRVVFGKEIAKMPKDAISHKTIRHTLLSSILFYKTETAFPEL